jgi:hypothetical protein
MKKTCPGHTTASMIYCNRPIIILDMTFCFAFVLSAVVQFPLLQKSRHINRYNLGDANFLSANYKRVVAFVLYKRQFCSPKLF